MLKHKNNDLYWYTPPQNITFIYECYYMSDAKRNISQNLNSKHITWIIFLYLTTMTGGYTSKHF